MVKYAPAAALLLIAVPATGTGAAVTPVPANKSSPETFSPREVHAYASALLEIQKVRQAVAFRADDLSDKDAALLKERARSEMMQAVARHGLDLPTFNAISNAVDSKRSLRREIRQLMMEEKLAI